MYVHPSMSVFPNQSRMFYLVESCVNQSSHSVIRLDFWEICKLYICTSTEQLMIRSLNFLSELGELIMILLVNTAFIAV